VKRPIEKRAPQEGALLRFGRQWAPFLAFFAVATAALAVECPADRIDEYVQVAHIHDGDTVRLADGRSVRFIGLNTPELGRDTMPAEPLATEARQALRVMIGRDGHIGLRYDTVRRDRYGRLLAHVYIDSGQSVVARMLEAGYGASIVIPPNLWNDQCYRGAETRARAKGLGVWSLAGYDRQATRLHEDDSGFRVISGRITGIREGRSSVWLELEGPLALRIARDDLSYFDDLDLGGLAGRMVRARGWIVSSHSGPMMQLRHPLSLEIVAAE
jgi:endonuclease YncB( thermonuclease family)